MDPSLALIDPALLALMHGSFGKDGTLLPFAREIMLVECHIAGTSHRDVKAAGEALAAGDLLVLQREPGNKHDPLAIMVFDESGRHLGYIPKVKNEAVARLMDAGKLLFGKVEAKHWRGAWLDVSLRVHLRDF